MQVARPDPGELEVHVRVAPGDRDHLQDPGPARVARDHLELRKVHADLVEIARIAGLHRARRVEMHRRVEHDRNVELHGLRVERVVALVVREQLLEPRPEVQAAQAELADTPLELANRRHALVRIRAGEADEHVRVLLADAGDHLVRRPPAPGRGVVGRTDHGPLHARRSHLRDLVGEIDRRRPFRHAVQVEVALVRNDRVRRRPGAKALGHARHDPEVDHTHGRSLLQAGSLVDEAPELVRSQQASELGRSQQ